MQNSAVIGQTDAVQHSSVIEVHCATQPKSQYACVEFVLCKG